MRVRAGDVTRILKKQGATNSLLIKNKLLMDTNLQNLPEKTTNGDIAKQIPNESAFSAGGFEHAQRVAKMLSSSDLVPQSYKGNIPNTMIAMEMSNRIGASPLMVMQNLSVIQGKPSWSSSFIIASLNNSKRFTRLNFRLDGEGEDYGCTAFAKDLKTGETLEGPKVDWKMVKGEGWLAKTGSKWKTMPELMFRYRAAAFFGRLYSPDILMGMQTVEESQDVAGDAVAEKISSKPVVVLPEEMIAVISETNDPEKLFDEIYKNNPEYHSNPEFMKLLLKRKKELNGATANTAA